MSLFTGKVAGDNPWDATGLAWKTTSPPPTHNFPQIPVVTTEAYAYPPEAAEQDAANWRPGSPL